MRELILTFSSEHPMITFLVICFIGYVIGLQVIVLNGVVAYQRAFAVDGIGFGLFADRNMSTRRVCPGSAGRVSGLNDSGGVNLAFTYDGSLPLSQTWSGGVVGSVSRTFTNNFDLGSESANGSNTITFGYDDDRLLTSAGALAIIRDAVNGLVTGTTLGSTTETHLYNTFGEPTRQTSNYNSTQLFDVQTTRDDLGGITLRIETFPTRRWFARWFGAMVRPEGS